MSKSMPIAWHREPWQEADAVGSYYEAIAELRHRHLAGEPEPTTGYFGSRPCDCERCRERRE